MSLIDQYRSQNRNNTVVAKLKHEMIYDQDSKYLILVDTGSETEEIGTYRTVEECKVDVDNLRLVPELICVEIYFYKDGFQLYNY